MCPFSHHSFKDFPDLTFDYISDASGQGRECAGYLYYIIQNYNNLPDYIEFAHGPLQRIPKLVRILCFCPLMKIVHFICASLGNIWMIRSHISSLFRDQWSADVLTMAIQAHVLSKLILRSLSIFSLFNSSFE